jgi:ArsR family transcriptional regulator
MMRMNEVFKALTDPTRREILRILSRGERTAGELAEPFDMTKPSMSHHFAVLKEAGLIRSRREGQQIYYALDTTVIEDVLTRIWDLFGTRPEAEDEKATEPENKTKKERPSS